MLAMGIKVVELETLKKYPSSQCFWLRIRKADFDATIENPDWPDGVNVRRYFRWKNNNNGSNNSGSGGGVVGGGGASADDVVADAAGGA